jgi:hypothetical protein
MSTSEIENYTSSYSCDTSGGMEVQDDWARNLRVDALI